MQLTITKPHLNCKKTQPERRLECHAVDIARAESYKSFRKYMRQRFLSNEGRVFRVHYKGVRAALLKTERESGAGIQVAPGSSLANRVEVRGKERKYKMPALETLLEDFFDHRKPRFVPKACELRK
jgi:hypothetical protein